jgi:hypothetical protein
VVHKQFYGSLAPEKARGIACVASGGLGGNRDEDAGRRVHGDAWREGGFVNFADVDGVVDWLKIEREERGKEANERALKVLEMLDVKERRQRWYLLSSLLLWSRSAIRIFESRYQLAITSILRWRRKNR